MLLSPSILTHTHTHTVVRVAQRTLNTAKPVRPPAMKQTNSKKEKPKEVTAKVTRWKLTLSRQQLLDHLERLSLAVVMIVTESLIVNCCSVHYNIIVQLFIL